LTTCYVQFLNIKALTKAIPAPRGLSLMILQYRTTLRNLFAAKFAAHVTLSPLHADPTAFDPTFLTSCAALLQPLTTFNGMPTSHHWDSHTHTAQIEMCTEGARIHCNNNTLEYWRSCMRWRLCISIMD